ncbi:MAG TPA: SdrD B-like domain-containing protein [Saprospiraceae bacterium]|nr:SdrD B-like domain-containing protein [Saprospiraceae bacterium]
MKILNVFGIFFLSILGLSAQISGTVFRDFNANGVQDNPSTGVSAGEVGAMGIIISAYDDNDLPNVPTSSTISGASGTYTLTGLIAGTNYRIEFIIPDQYDYSGPIGASNASSVRFINYSSAVNEINFGINYPDNYCQNLNPNLLFTRMINGDPTAGGSSGTTEALFSAPYNSTGQTPSFTIEATQAELGSTWGAAFNKNTKKFFSSAVIRRHAGLSSSGVGAIFVTDFASVGTPTSLLINVDPIFDVGNIPSNSSRGLPANIGDPSLDTAAFWRVGKQGFGDIDLSEDFNTLYAVNLNKKKYSQN